VRAGALEGRSGKMCLFVYDKKAKAILMSIEELTAGN
jgi:hypothetical protein